MQSVAVSLAHARWEIRGGRPPMSIEAHMMEQTMLLREIVVELRGLWGDMKEMAEGMKQE